MKQKQITKEVVLIIITLLPILYLVTNWNILPEKLPSHFDLKGNVNGYSSKYLFAILPVIIYLLLLVLPYIDPRKKNYTIFQDSYFKLRVIMMLFFWFINSLVIWNTLHNDVNMARIVPVLVCFLFMLIGNYMGNIRPNYFVGIKVPWTLNSDEVWTRTHKLAGKLWFWGGLLGVVVLCFGVSQQFVVIPIVVIITLIPIVYSYIIYQKSTLSKK